MKTYPGFSSCDGAAAFDARYFHATYKHYGRRNPASKLAFYRDLLQPHLDAQQGAAAILDLGCGPGFFLGSIESRYAAYGVDISEFAIRQARARAPEAHLCVASCSGPPLKRTFGAVVAFDVLEHVPDVDGVADYVKSALLPGGVFVFVVPVYDGPLGPVVHALDRDRTHIHKYSRHSWLTWASSHFTLQDWIGIFRWLVPGGPYLHWPTAVLRDIAPAIAVVARVS